MDGGNVMGLVTERQGSSACLSVNLIVILTILAVRISSSALPLVILAFLGLGWIVWATYVIRRRLAELAPATSNLAGLTIIQSLRFLPLSYATMTWIALSVALITAVSIFCSWQWLKSVRQQYGWDGPTIYLSIAVASSLYFGL